MLRFILRCLAPLPHLFMLQTLVCVTHGAHGLLSHSVGGTGKRSPASSPRMGKCLPLLCIVSRWGTQLAGESRKFSSESSWVGGSCLLAEGNTDWGNWFCASVQLFSVLSVWGALNWEVTNGKGIAGRELVFQQCAPPPSPLQFKQSPDTTKLLLCVYLRCQMLYLSQELILKIFFYLCFVRRVLWHILLGLVLLKLRRAFCFSRLSWLHNSNMRTLFWNRKKASPQTAQSLCWFSGR